MTFADLWMVLDRAGFETMRALFSVLWQSSILLGAAGLLALAMRRRSAAARQTIWAVAIVLTPLLPILAHLATSAAVPQAPIPVMPEYTAPQPVIPVAPLPATPAVEWPPPPMAPVRAWSPLDYPWAMALLAYAAGATALMTLVLVGRFRIGRWLRRGRVATDAGVLAVFESARTLLALKREFTVVESAAVHAPLTIGTLHPAVLLPTGFAAGLSQAELQAVAIHELSHVARRDAPLLAILSCVRAALWFHPLVWLACRQVATLAEQACDDRVLEATGEPVSYARLLARLAEELPRRALGMELAAGVVFSKGALLKRVEAILSHRRDQIRRLSRAALVATVLGAIVSVAVALALPLADKPPPAEAEKAAAPVADDVQVNDRTFATVVADRFVSALRGSALPWLDESKLKALRDSLERLIKEHQPAGMSDELCRTLEQAVQGYVKNHFPRSHTPAGGAYLAFPDQVKTFEWELWLAMQRKPLAAADLARREAQRDWLRAHIRSLPEEGKVYTHKAALDQLEGILSDPFCPPFYKPMTEEQFEQVKTRLQKRLAGQMEIAFVVPHIVWECLRAQYPSYKDFVLPFKDEVDQYGQGSGQIEIGFKSNFAFRGRNLSMSPENLLDVSAAMLRRADEAKLLEPSRRGDVALEEAGGRSLVAVRGARLMPLAASDWFEVDQMTDAPLLTPSVLKEVDRFSLAPFQGMQPGDQVVRPEEFRKLPSRFLAVRTAEGNLSVLEVKSVDRGSVDLHIRPRPAAAPESPAAPPRVKQLEHEVLAQAIKMQQERKALQERYESLKNKPQCIHGSIDMQGVDLSQVRPVRLQLWRHNRGGRIAETALTTNGKFAFDSVEPGVYTVVCFEREGNPGIRYQNVTVEQGKVLDALDIGMPSGTIVVHVVDEKGGAISGAKIVVGKADDPSGNNVNLFTFRNGLTDAKGVFEATKLTDGHYVVTANFGPTEASGGVLELAAEARVEHTLSIRISEAQIAGKIRYLDAKANLMNWVEDFFSKNYRDITARQTLEWGEVQKEPGGNLSIRYKYLATIWDKDKFVIEEQYTFGPDGKFVSVKSLSKVPAVAPAPANRPAGLPENASAQLIGTWRELLNPRDLIFRPDRTFELLQMDRPKPGLLLAGTWELDGRLLTRKITQSPENAARAGQEERQEIWVLSPGFLELRTPGGPGPLWQYERLPVNDKAIAPAN